MIDISQIKPGDELEYIYIRSRRGGVQPIQKKQTGTVVQITKKFISLKGPRYPDTISIADLHTGKTQITEIKESGTMGAVREMPPEAELARVFRENSWKINPVAKYYATSWGKVRDWLSDCGLIDINTGVATMKAKELEEAEKPGKTYANPDLAFVRPEFEKAVKEFDDQFEQIVQDAYKLNPPYTPADNDNDCDPDQDLRQPDDIFKELANEAGWGLDNIIDIAVQAITNPARAAVRQVLETPMALEMMKELIRQGVV